jgi:hypothetical protein
VFGGVAVLAAGAVVVGAHAPLQAQQQPPAPDSVRAAFAYETVLRTAVSLGGRRLADQARQVVPEVILTTEPAIVRGLRLANYGFLFDVQAPDIQSTLLVWDMMRSPLMQPGRGGPAQNVAQGRAAATGVVEDDPMEPPAFDPSTAYSSYVREALIDAMLDNSTGLPLGPEDRLTITASGIEQADANPLYRSPKLILTISGADLQAFRQGRLDREQAKARIVEDRF